MLPTFLTALFVEKEYVWPFLPIDGSKKGRTLDADLEWEPLPPKAPGSVPVIAALYLAGRDRDAQERHFLSLGSFHHVDTKLYALRYDFWISPDRLILAMVKGGTILSIPCFGTHLFTRLRDGRWLLTVDDLKWDSTNPSALMRREVIHRAGFEELLERHRARIAGADSSANPYAEDDPLEDHRAMLRSDAEDLARCGLARFVDDERTTWRCTLRGAINATLWGYGRQLQLREICRGLVRECNRERDRRAGLRSCDRTPADSAPKQGVATGSRGGDPAQRD
jgi:hypothetical protein